jgi:hypothetical protein
MQQAVFVKFSRFETLCRLVSGNPLAKSEVSLNPLKNALPEQRYWHLLQTRPGLPQGVPLHQLVSFRGIKPESLSRIRRRMLARNKA